jgi:hypothetical protein
MLRVRVNDLFHKRSTGIWLVEDRNGKTYIGEPLLLNMKYCGDGACLLPEPTLELSYEHTRDFFQGLTNELSRLGYAPDTSRIAGELDATKKHLEDMREFSKKMLEAGTRD